MASVGFLYRSKKDESTLVARFSFREEGEKSPTSFYAQTRIEVKKEFWAKIDEKLKGENKDLQEAIQTKCIDLRKFVLKAHEAESNPTKEWFKKVISNYYNPPKPKRKTPTTLLEYFDYYLELNPKMKEGSVRKLRSIRSRIRKHLGNIEISEIDDEFKIRAYKALSDYSHNTIEYTIREIKLMCLRAERKGITLNNDVREWKIEFNATPIIYLDENELTQILELRNLPEHLENAKDWLLISCYTGQRISDFMRFDKSMIRLEKNSQGKIINLLEFTQIKTGALSVVPLSDEVLAILEKRNGNFPEPINETRYNEYIKSVCRRAGISHLISGSKKIEIRKGVYRKVKGKYPKHELVSSHIGRRSFASNNFGKIPTPLLMSATGHKREDTFLKYVGKTRTDSAKSLADYY